MSSRRRLHLPDPRHGAGEIDKSFEGADGFLAAQGDASEAFDLIEETFNQMALLVEVPIGLWLDRATGVGFDLGGCAQIISDEGP